MTVESPAREKMLSLRTERFLEQGTNYWSQAWVRELTIASRRFIRLPANELL